MPKKKYSTRTDIEKLQSQWRKLSGLHSREEWSAAVVRAATAAEIAANLVIRVEFKSRSEFSEEYVNEMLKWANGIVGKFDRLIQPLWMDDANKKKHFKKLKSVVGAVNELRNKVVHQGEFCNQGEAEAVIEKAEHLILNLVLMYEPEFSLKKHKNT